MTAYFAGSWFAELAGTRGKMIALDTRQRLGLR